MVVVVVGDCWCCCYCFVAYNGVQKIRSEVTNKKIILARREVGNKCRLYKPFVEFSFDIVV